MWSGVFLVVAWSEMLLMLMKHGFGSDRARFWGKVLSSRCSDALRAISML